MFNIRLYTEADYEMIKWWAEYYFETPPTKEMLPLNTTFICEINKIPSLTVTAYYTNCKEVSYLEHYFGNPDMEGPLRKEAGQRLLGYVSELAKNMGFKRIVCLGYKEKVKKRYEEMGFIKTLDNLSSFVKELN